MVFSAVELDLLDIELEAFANLLPDAQGASRNSPEPDAAPSPAAAAVVKAPRSDSEAVQADALVAALLQADEDPRLQRNVALPPRPPAQDSAQVSDVDWDAILGASSSAAAVASGLACPRASMATPPGAGGAGGPTGRGGADGAAEALRRGVPEEAAAAKQSPLDLLEGLDDELARRLLEMDEEASMVAFSEEDDEDYARRIGAAEQEAHMAAAAAAAGAAAGEGADDDDDAWDDEVEDLLFALRLQEEEERGAAAERAAAEAAARAGAEDWRNAGPEVWHPRSAGAGGRAPGMDGQAGLAAAAQWDGDVDDLLLALELTAGDGPALESAGPPAPPPAGSGVTTR